MNSRATTHSQQKLIHYLPDVHYTLVIADQCTLKSVSNQSIQLLGYSPEEILDADVDFLQKLIHPDDRASVLKMRKQALGSGKLNTFEYRVLTKSGNTCQVVDRWISYNLPGTNDWIIEGQLSETKDVEIKSRLVQQLKAYRNAVDVNIISSITDVSGKIIYANENFCKISRYSVTELIGQNHRIICSGHHPRSFFVDMWKTIATGNVWQGEILNKAKDGSLYWVDTVIIPIFDNQKRIEKYLSLRMLITDRKRSEEQRNQYIESLEKIAFIVAHDIRGPLCSILGLVHILVSEDTSTEELHLITRYLKDSANKLDKITGRLSQFLFENEIEFQSKWLDKVPQDYLSKN